MSRWETSNSQYGRFYDTLPKRRFVLQPSGGSDAPRGDRKKFEEALRKYRLKEHQVAADGACQFRSLSHQLYGTDEHHLAVRTDVVEHIRKNMEQFSGFMAGDPEQYLRDMARMNTWGDHLTLQAAADLYGVKVCLFTTSPADPLCIVEIEPKQRKSEKCLLMSFWSESHYNSLMECTAEGSPVAKEYRIRDDGVTCCWVGCTPFWREPRPSTVVRQPQQNGPNGPSLRY
mmetsp:Transcript_33570/g.81152  ORF Transcript_33570/g.81152 Transcript_33570/m.81152 type:complete len:230 (+) Transcript_33570:68-757(+)